MQLRPLLLGLLTLLAMVAACHHSGNGGGPLPTGTLSSFATPSATPTPGPGVLEHHHGGNRRGVYVIPGLTQAAAATLILDTTFTPALSGNSYAQPLFLVDPAGHDLVVAVTESNQVSAFWASNGSVAWQRKVAPAVPLSALPCGDIDPLGITGTPVIDSTSMTLFFDAMTDAGGGNPKHEIYALSLIDGSTAAGWPVDLDSSVSSGGVVFTSLTQNQRPGLTLLDGSVYAAYGGHAGDCSTYYGWLVGVDEANPASVAAWRSPLPGSAIWGPSGPASDGYFIYADTGNSTLAPDPVWQGTESLFRFKPGPIFSGSTNDYFAPSNFEALDAGDLDMSGTEPVLIDIDGFPPAQLVVLLGKDGFLYLIDRTNLGGVGGQLFGLQVSTSEIINAAAAYQTGLGQYVVFKVVDGLNCPGGVSGDLVSVRITPGNPPTAAVAWCAEQSGGGSPMVTQTQVDGGDTIVWGLGTESDDEGAGDSRLHGFDGDTGAVVYAGGGANEQMGALRRFITPIAARGRIFVAGDGKLYAFRVP